jgi:hypothetical protein
VGRWLDKEEDDGRISLDLEPNKKPASKNAGQSHVMQSMSFPRLFFMSLEPAKPASDPNKSERALLANNVIRMSLYISGTPYVVTVQTGNVTGAGTDAKVFLSFNGDKTKIAKHQLQKPEGGKNAFEKGNKDVFKFDEADVGKVRVSVDYH